MAQDTYRNFKELQDKEPRNNYNIVEKRRNTSPVAIIAPHGGKIEYHTSLICKQIAKHDYSYYCFEGKRHNKNCELHITSTNFDEPKCLDLISSCNIVVAIHGCRNPQSDRNPQSELTYLGGKDDSLKTEIRSRLEESGFSVDECENFSGSHKDNICNRGARKKGVQLEITRTLRDKLKEDREKLNEYAEAIRDAIRDEIEKNR